MNHIWLRHFGAPLVDNMFDFGLRSPQARNQPLLDWLAVELMEHNWQMKRIHRLLVTSSAYRMKSGGADVDARNLAADRDNRYLWRMNSRRLEAEAVRDALLHVAGKLDLAPGGPEVDCELASQVPRRSIYLRHAYEKQTKFLELFDGASVNECYRRGESVVPKQALALANSDVSLDQSRILAANLTAELTQNPPPSKGGARGGITEPTSSPTYATPHLKSNPETLFITLAFNQILNRPPSPAELNDCRAFLASQTKMLADPTNLTPFEAGEKPAIDPASDPQQRARENLVHVLYNHNDFLTIH